MLVIPLLLTVSQKRRRAVLHYSTVQGLKTLQPSNPHAGIPMMLRVLAIIFLVIALARPQEGRKSMEILSVGVDIILATDTSGSMQALDFFKDKNRVNRLDVVKEVVREFIDNRPNDRMGMVTFGAEAFTQCPLTMDHSILLSFLDNLKIGMAGDSTAIGSAIGVAVKRLKDLKAKSKVIILLTDGRNNSGNIPPLQAAEIAKSYGIKIYTIGIGTLGKAPFLVDTFMGKQLIYQDVDLDEDTLKTIAATTDGKYFRATDRETLKDIYTQIDKLEKSEVKVIDHAEYNELFPPFLICGLSLILMEIVLANTRLRRIP